MRSGWRACAVALLCAFIGCRHLGAADPRCSGEVARVGALAPRVLHLRAQLTRDGETRRHEAVLQVASDRITLVGLTPIGTRAFVVASDASGLSVDEGIGRRMGQSPRLLYDAIAHAYLAPGSPAPAEAPGVRVAFEPGGAARVENPACGYEAKLVLVPAPDTRAPAKP